MQLVNLTEGGERVQMSKRAGTLVLLDDLLDDIGVDATRWFLLQRSHDTTIDLDLDLARSESQDNPVYYVQYAHARIAGILAKAGEERVRQALEADLRASAEQLHPSARSLIKRLLDLPDQLREAGDRRAPHRLTAYAHETAQEFSAFYRDVKVVGAADEGGDEDVRLAAVRGHEAACSRARSTFWAWTRRSRCSAPRGGSGSESRSGGHHGRVRPERLSVRVDVRPPAGDPGAHRHRRRAARPGAPVLDARAALRPGGRRARSWRASAAGRSCASERWRARQR